MSRSVTVLVEHRYRNQAQPAGLIGALRERGAAVRVLSDADLPALAGGDELAETLQRSDVVVARGRSEALLAGLCVAEGLGRCTVDRSEAIRTVRDKRLMGARLAASGLPVPHSWVGTGVDLARQIGRDLLHGRVRSERLIAKPAFGDNSAGIVVLETGEGAAVRSRRDAPRVEVLAALRALPGELVVQELVPSDGLDLKLYVIGDQVWATRKSSPVTGPTGRPPGPTRVTPSLRRLALQSGRLFGLTVFGVDCIETPTGPVVIEVNDFPNFTQVPGARRLLADHVLEAVA